MPPTPSQPGRRRRLWSLLLIGLAAFLIGLISMPREEYRADPMAVRCETVSMLNTHSLEIPPAIATTFGDGERGQFFFQNPKNNKWYCKYGILNSFLYLPSLWIEKQVEGKTQLEYLSPTRVIYLDCFNLVVQVATACYLFLLASRYARSSLAAVLFVFSSLYCTYWWYYLRAQNSEIYQTFFLLAFFYYLSSSFTPAEPAAFLSPRPRKTLLLAGTFLALLILVKSLYVLLVPITFGWLLFFEWNWFRGQQGLSFWKLNRTWLIWLGVPIACALAVLFSINAFKFGSPFESGYSQWQERGKPIFSGHFPGGLNGFLLSRHYSIFLHFPVLVFAFFGYPRFFKKHRLEATLFMTTGVILLCLYSKMLEWPGGWGYGPRYMLPILPLLALPFIETLDYLLTNLWMKQKPAPAAKRRAGKAATRAQAGNPVAEADSGESKKWWSLGGLAIIGIILACSCKAELNVNALPFFAYFDLQGLFAQVHDPQVDAYFADHDLDAVNRDLLAYKKGDEVDFPPLDLISMKINPRGLMFIRSFIQQRTYSNYYFFPDPPAQP